MSRYERTGKITLLENPTGPTSHRKGEIDAEIQTQAVSELDLVCHDILVTRSEY